MSDINDIWGMATKLSHAMHLEDEIKEIKQKLRESDTCGDCYYWMKSSLCPREKSDNSGYSKGPSCNGSICGKFELKEWVKNFRAEKQAELESLKEELRQYLAKMTSASA